MIDIQTEDLMDLKEAAREPVFRSPKTKKPAHVASIYRHVLRGGRAANGERVKLETIRTPSGLRTSRQAVERFIAALTNPDAAPAPTPSQRRREIEAAEKRLELAGI